jgi:Icc-related predicted phosphoesterase
MIIIGLSDVHGSVGSIEMMKGICAKADVVLFVGDITNFGREKEADHVISPILDLPKKVFAVSGNCDYHEVDLYLDNNQINLHGRGEHFEDISFIGLGGSLITPFNTPNEMSESEITNYLQKGFVQVGSDNPSILVSHQPPEQTLCDRLSSGEHVGSKSVREFIEKQNPLACFTGHIHESIAIDKIGESYVINPGMLPSGKYAYVKIGKSIEEIEIRSFDQ